MLKKAGIALLVLIAAIGLLIAIVVHRPPPPASQAFINATVLTMNASDDVAEAIFVQHDRIVAVGSRSEIDALIESDTEIHDLGGRTLIPGFIDAHGHFPGSGLITQGPDLSSPPVGDVESIEQIVDKLRAHAANTAKGEWILGLSYDDTLVAEKRHPTRHDLDRASTDHPIVATHVSGHLAVANSRALELAKIDRDTPDPAGGVIQRDADGEPTGVLEETAAQKITQAGMDFSAGEFFEMIAYAAAEYAAMGVTTAQSGLTPLFMVDALYYASKLGRIPFRLEVWGDKELGLATVRGEFDPDEYRTDDFAIGAVKIIGDGSIQGYTGYLTQPYHVPFKGDANYRGYPAMSREELADLVTTLHKADLRIAIHGNGDAAIDDIIFAVERAQQEHKRDDPRVIVIHAQMTRPDQLDRMRELGITPSFYVAHTYYWGDRHRDIFMGPVRASRISPTSTATKKGVRFSIHLDTPVVPMNPMLLVWSAVNRVSTSGAIIGPAERISPNAALRAVTIDAAWQIFQENDRGSIEAGKLADLVVLAENPLEHPTRIREIAVERTVVGGRTTFLKVD
ncbi:MAG: amidohydrolase [Deltaproteobacteria bacterium]|nr:amidohydrolase [Deltaproteobacteria bacterium]